MAVAFFFFLFGIFSSPPVYIISYCKQYVKRFRENILVFLSRRLDKTFGYFIVVRCKVVKGFARFPIPVIYIYFFLFPYERLEKPSSPTPLYTLVQMSNRLNKIFWYLIISCCGCCGWCGFEPFSNTFYIYLFFSFSV